MSEIFELSLWMVILYLVALIVVCGFMLSFPVPSEAESGWRIAAPCKLDDWLCKSMMQLCQALPDPCTATNIDQAWHPENPSKYMNAVVKPSPIHAEQHPEDRAPSP